MASLVPTSRSTTAQQPRPIDNGHPGAVVCDLSSDVGFGVSDCFTDLFETKLGFHPKWLFLEPIQEVTIHVE